MTAQPASQSVNLRALLPNEDIEVPSVGVTDLTANSRQVQPGGLFLACNGFRHHGLEFVHEAVANNAAAVAWEPADGVDEPELPDNVVNLRVTDLGNKVGGMAHRFFAAPSEAVAVTAITGTNGKTTTAYLAAEALKKLGHASGYMGTLGYGVGGQLRSSALTTPGVISVHRRLREMADLGADAVVMEVSSHGIDQGRIDAVRVSVAAFTNLSRDHLDYHGSMEAYGNTKAQLFLQADAETAVINIGDPFGARLSQQLPASLKTITVARSNGTAEIQADVTAELLEATPAGLHLRFSGVNCVSEMHSPMWGEFNVENLLVAIGIVLAHGHSLADSVAALEECPLPAGRMQLIQSGEQQPVVVVDFAHTPDALGKALQALRDHCAGRIWCVFGCGGDRDAGKRAPMGAVAAELADIVIVTDDNPRNEDPKEIVQQILVGAGDVAVEHNRALAISKAISDARADDVVLIAGKGSEALQIVGDAGQEFSDAAVAAKLLGQAA
jgi:UDP-N-acetylmuramoyl-L-alanyl-D-glutamate--2,6-diaminopimelate ligase